MPEATALARAVEGVADARTLWARLGAIGVPGDLTGPSPDPGRLDELLSELDRATSLSLALSATVQVALAVPLLRTVATGTLAAAASAQSLAGRAVVALAATEAGLSGSALLDAATEVHGPRGALRLTGGKEWITNATHCDYLLVLARYRPERHFTSFRWVLLPAGTPGVSVVPAAKDRFAGAGVGHVRFDAVALTGEHLVGRPGRALAEFSRQLTTERLASALWARTLCRRVLAGAREYLMGRSAGAATLWDNAAVRDRFARCLLSLAHLDALCATVLPAGATTAAAMVLKATSGATVDRVLDECVRLRGAEAFRDGGLADLRDEAAMFGVAGGATGALLAGIADWAEDLLRAPR